MKSKLKFFALMALICCVEVDASAQRENSQPDTWKGVRLDRKKPTVYLEFVKVGTCRRIEPLSFVAEHPCETERTDKSVEVFEAVWVRIRNNSRWSIDLKARSFYIPVKPYILHDGREVTMLSDGFEIQAEYGVEAEYRYERIESEKGIEYKLIDVKAPYVAPFSFSVSIILPPGRSLIFAVRREHLAKYLMIFPNYKYEWETTEGDFGTDEPQHRAYFTYYDLEKALEKK